MKTVAIIQARMGSTRLPGKVMMNLCGKTVLEHVITRVKQAKEIDKIVIATTTSENDNIIAQETERLGVEYFKGSEEDVLSRYYYAAKENNADVVVRITSDCPLIDPKIVDKVINVYKNNKYDLVTNAGLDLDKRTFPRGLDLEVFSFNVLSKTHKNAKEMYQREHVSPYIYEDSNNVFVYKNDINYSKYRWTLDTEEDWKLISEIYHRLYLGEHNFGLNEIVELFKNDSRLWEINQYVEQKKIY